MHAAHLAEVRPPLVRPLPTVRLALPIVTYRGRCAHLLYDPRQCVRDGVGARSAPPSARESSPAQRVGGGFDDECGLLTGFLCEEDVAPNAAAVVRALCDWQSTLEA